MSKTTGRDLISVVKSITIGENVGYLIKVLNDCIITKVSKDDYKNDLLRNEDFCNIMAMEGDLLLLNSFDLGCTLSREEFKCVCTSISGKDVFLFFDESETNVKPLVGYSSLGTEPDDPLDLTFYEKIEDLPKILEEELPEEDIEYIKLDVVSSNELTKKKRV